MQPFERSLALVGIGYWGKNLARNFHALGVLHTICDTNIELLQANKEKYPDVALTTDLDSLLTNDAISSLAIAAPAIQHYELARKALLAGKDVFVEKPICLTVREAEELVAFAKNACILMVGHICTTIPACKSYRKW